MKTLIALLLVAFPGTNNSGKGTLEVEVTNFKSYQGVAYLSVYTNEENFIKKAIRVERIELTEDQPVIFKLDSLPFGTYAVSIIQDENLNGELDSGTFGIPKEGYGFSNNARGMFGPPSYDDSKFTFERDTKMTISLIHPPF